MSQTSVVQLTCDRCKRTGFLPASEAKPQGSPPDFNSVFMGQQLVFPDLCQKCKEAVANILEDLKQWDREIKYAHIRIGGEQTTAPPLQPAPDLNNPPKPHSAAGGARR